MSRLITFGCSHTYGQGLSDCRVNTYEPGPTPSKFAWPQVLADKLNLECVNMSEPGTSPKRNWYSITNFDFNEDDIVIVKWPNPNKTCIIKEDKIEHLAPWDKSNNKLVKFYYK